MTGPLPAYVDVLIVGAGLSGVGTAVHLQRQQPSTTFLLVEARAVSGGTWDLFRYPAVRSDSDMYTLGYSFAPWLESKSLADGPSILRYIRETATTFGIDKKMYFERRVLSAQWSSATAEWTVEILDTSDNTTHYVRCNFLWGNTGYYRYDVGHRPEFVGQERFTGTVVHPQHWPGDLDVTGKRVVVIGSGATAVTLVPALAQSASQVVMLQRSPTWIVARPDVDASAMWLQGKLSVSRAYAVVRAKNILLGLLSYQISRRRPALVKRAITKGIIAALPKDYDVATHFTPSYNPWDQRLCLVPNGDLFAAISDGRAEVVTDTIESWTENGIRVSSGREIAADIIVTATGLTMQFLGGITLSIDGAPFDMSEGIVYKGIMLCGVPNFAMTFGYTNASWTLKADLTSLYICRLLARMSQRGYRQCTPVAPTGKIEVRRFMDLNAGYVLRAASSLPQQTTRRPWTLHNNYLRDTLMLKRGRLTNQMTLNNRVVAKN